MNFKRKPYMNSPPLLRCREKKKWWSKLLACYKFIISCLYYISETWSCLFNLAWTISYVPYKRILYSLLFFLVKMQLTPTKFHQDFSSKEKVWPRFILGNYFYFGSIDFYKFQVYSMKVFLSTFIKGCC